MPEMETKFPDYTEKLTEFVVKKPIFITYNFVNSSACFLYFSISLMFLCCQVCQQTVRLIFLHPASCLFETRYLQIVAFYCPLFISVSCLFSRFFQGK